MSFFWAFLALVWLAVLYQQNYQRDVASKRRGREALEAIRTELLRNLDGSPAREESWSKLNYLTAVRGGSLSSVPMELVASLVEVYEPEAAGRARSPELVNQAVEAITAHLGQTAPEPDRPVAAP
jgi:hypothetical protein